MRVPLETAGTLILLAFASAACGTRSSDLSGTRPVGTEGECPRWSADAAPETLRVGAAGPVSPTHAPVPRTSAERLVFRHLYGTLVRLDCHGRPYPGLAESWTAEEGGRRWIFVLSEDARFWDGAELTAAEVRASWLAYGGATRLQRELGLPADSIIAWSRRRLVLAFATPGPEIVAALAHPALAVARPRPPSGWALGTGTYRPAAGTDPAREHGRSVARVLAISTRPDMERPAAIEFILADGLDGRDLIDRGVDLLIAEDAVTLDYVGPRADYRAYPLPWTRLRAMIVPGAIWPAPPRPPEAIRVSGAASERTRTDARDGLVPSFREALIRDVVRVEARPARGPGWWAEGATCAAASLPLPTATSGRAVPGKAGSGSAVVYAHGDGAGRDLAERLVALGAAGQRSPPSDSLRWMLERLFPAGPPDSVVEWTAAELEAAAAEGAAMAYIVDVPLRPIWPCEEGWLLRRWPAFPLVETRSHAVLRPGRVDATIDADGTPVIGTLPADRSPR